MHYLRFGIIMCKENSDCGHVCNYVKYESSSLMSESMICYTQCPVMVLINSTCNQSQDISCENPCYQVQ